MIINVIIRSKNKITVPSMELSGLSLGQFLQFRSSSTQNPNLQQKINIGEQKDTSPPLPLSTHLSLRIPKLLKHSILIFCYNLSVIDKLGNRDTGNEGVVAVGALRVEVAAEDLFLFCFWFGERLKRRKRKRE